MHNHATTAHPERAPLAHGPDARRSAATAQPSAHQTNRVLLVEDDRQLSMALESRLSSRGLEVTAVLDGAAATRALFTSKFDVVVLDLGLPDRCGLDVLHETQSFSRKVPVIVLTGADANDCSLARVLGATEVLRKPCVHWSLVDAIERALER